MLKIYSIVKKCPCPKSHIELKFTKLNCIYTYILEKRKKNIA